MRISHFKYLLFCTIFAVPIFSEAKKVKISVYYETLCPECVRLIGSILSIYQELGKYIELDFVPFGKAYMVKNIIGEWFFQCQHGPSECFGNAVHACALDQQLEDLPVVEFFNCTMVAKDISQCAFHSGVNMRTLNYCMNTKGASLLAEYGLKTSKDIEKLNHVPTIIFNDEYDENMDEKGRKNIKNQICSLLNYKPETCQIENIIYKNMAKRNRKKMKKLRYYWNH